MPADNTLLDLSAGHNDGALPYKCSQAAQPPGPRGAAWAINYGYCRTSLDYHPPVNPQGSNDPRCPDGCPHKAPEYVALRFSVIFAKPGEHGGAKNAAAYACQHHAASSPR